MIAPSGLIRKVNPLYPGTMDPPPVFLLGREKRCKVLTGCATNLEKRTEVDRN